MKEIPIKLRSTEIEVLKSMLKEHIAKGEYWGRKDQHDKMCSELLTKLGVAESLLRICGKKEDSI